MPDPVARTPIRPAEMVTRSGWEIAAPHRVSGLTLSDQSAMAKTLVRARPDGPMAEAVAVPFGRVARGPGGSTILSTSPGEWLVLNAASEASAQRARLLELAEPSAGQELVTVLDLTHGRAVIRLTGTRAAAVLAKLCAIDLSPSATPSGRAFRTSVARLVTDVARHDEQDPAGAITSFLLHCDRSYGQYLWNAVLDAASAG